MLRSVPNRILMCRPDYFRVCYRINPWMSNSEPVKAISAQRQWTNLKETLEKCGAMVEVMLPVPGVPDLVFTANAAVVRKNKAFISHFYNEQRRPERELNIKWFLENNYEIFDADYAFEGAGEAFFAGGKLFASYGFRTDRRVYEKLVQHFGPFQKVIYCQLVDEKFYHLDTAFCPLSPELAIFYPKAFSDESVKAMENEIELMAVSEKEACKFACNTVVVNGKHAVLPSGNEETAKMIEKRGLETHLVDVSEFLKAGGACKCLTLDI